MITKRDFHFSRIGGNEGCMRAVGGRGKEERKRFGHKRIHSKWLTFSLESKVVIYAGAKLSGRDELFIVSTFSFPHLPPPPTTVSVPFFVSTFPPPTACHKLSSLIMIISFRQRNAFTFLFVLKLVLLFRLFPSPPSRFPSLSLGGFFGFRLRSR